MNFDEYQEAAVDFDIGAVNPDHARFVHLLGLAGEVGEFLEPIKKHVRDGGEIDMDDLKKEAGDVLWYLAVILDDLGVSFDEVAQMNIEKLADRRERNKLAGKGDHR